MDDLIGKENVNQQQGNDELDEHGYLRPRVAANNGGGAGGIGDGNANAANVGIGEMGKAFISLAQQLSDLQRSNREFELMTCGWSEQERVEALNVKLEDRARLTLSSMPPHLQSVYSAVKAEILERLANDESKRVTKLSELMTGKVRKPSEPILDFGERVLKLVRDACDPSVPSRQVDEMAKAYFLTYVNDKDLIASLTEKQDSLEFRYLVDHAAALRANLDRFRRIAGETSSSQQAQTGQQSSQSPSTQQGRSGQASRLSGNASQQQRLNPYRTELRYQGFPPARGNFQAQVPSGQRPSNAAADVVQPQGSDVIDSPGTAQFTPASPP
ncbi:hypothetical protein AAVH_42025 [Aphelenchoides avenae]|nr:hypothetical protein AAVH_42025 [Aphelenchus avenae]